jgi:hypothetical protein
MTNLEELISNCRQFSIDQYEQEEERMNDLMEANWPTISKWIAEALRPRLVVDNTMTAQPNIDGHADAWAKTGRASSAPIIELSPKSRFPEPVDDGFDEEAAVARASARVDFKDVKEATLRSLDFIIPRLLPGGKRVRDEWVVRNPTRSDKKARSFSINMETGVWADFATGDSGGDMMDLYVYLNGGTNVQAKDALAALLGVQARQQRSSGSTDTESKSDSSTAGPTDFREPPTAFPPRTPPDKDGKPAFVVAGNDGPPPRSNEKRRHVYCQGGVPVRIKIIKNSAESRAFNAYRVTGADGVTGWQFAMPDGYQRIPYFVAEANPFTAAINQPVFWAEGERDVETVARLGGLGYTFGGCGDGLPHGCEQYVVGRPVVILADNDDEGRKHAEKKAALVVKVATSAKIIHFRELEDKQDVSDWAAIAGNTLIELMARAERTEAWKPLQDAPDLNEIEIFWHGRSYDREARPALVKDLIPQTGQGLASGQWGAGKTFAVIDLSACVMTGTPFAGREVCRRGGVLFIAAEGASEIPIRIQGVVDHKLRPNPSLATEVDINNLPFAWIEECPSLKEDASFERLVGIVLVTAAQMKERFNVDLALIIIDTLSASADFSDANDAAEGQRIMNRLNTLSRRTGAFVLAVDHFGKSVEGGTRGTSAKEAAADVVLALLADRDVAGNVTNTRLAVRKLRGGATGAETPFELKVVDLGFDQTTCIIEWRPERTPTSAPKAGRESKAARMLRASMNNAMAALGKTIRPFGHEGPSVRAVALRPVREEFVAAWPADGDTPAKVLDAKRSAFNRGLASARQHDVCSREVDGTDYLWFVTEPEKPRAVIS